MATSAHAFDPAIAVTRFGLGARPGEIEAASADPRGWLLAQVRPAGAAAPSGAWPTARDRLAALAGFHDQIKSLRADFDHRPPSPMTPAVLSPVSQPIAPPGTPSSPAAPDPKADFNAARKAAKQPIDDETNAEVLARAQLAATTPDGFAERWALFWSNHFTVASKNEEMQTLAPVFEREAIRPHVFGPFASLLAASTTHAGMIHYLDQVRSIGPDSPAGLRGHNTGLNENLAREVLELHTVGADAGYTQADVTEFARALTGVTVGNGQPNGGATGAVVFRADWHEPGTRTVMGRRYADDGGPKAASDIVDALAADPRTARRLSRKIAAHFVADDPPPALCARLERAWTGSGGDLAHVARTLATAPEAWRPTARKLKTPYEFLVSAWRAADVAPADVRKDVLNPLGGLGQRPFYASQPNGWADAAYAWAAPDAVLKRLYWAQGFAGAHAAALDPLVVGREALGDRLSPAAAEAIGRAASRPEAFALLLMTPEFQRR